MAKKLLFRKNIFLGVEDYIFVWLRTESELSFSGPIRFFSCVIHCLLSRLCYPPKDIINTGRPLSKVLPFPNKGSRSCFINVPQLRDISYPNMFNVHRPNTIHVQTVFSLYTASLRLSISPWIFVLICVVLSYLSVNTVHLTLLHTVVYGTHSGWCRQERNKVARELKHKVFCLVWSVLKEVHVKKAENDSPCCFSWLEMSICYLASISVLPKCTFTTVFT
jgi:hypothetical protein